MSTNYASALEIISDAAVGLGLGQVVDAYGSTDANIIQLRGILKSAGRKLVFDRDWNHLTREYSFVTLPNWKAGAHYQDQNSIDSWDPNFIGQFDPIVTSYVVSSNGNLYQCVSVSGSPSTTGTGPGPQTQSQSILDGNITWAYRNTGTAPVVVKGKYQYLCVTGGVSGTIGPSGIILDATETDGTVTWQNVGRAADYTEPAGFSNMIDQTGWNRTNRLPLGGPVSAQVWQYLKGRQQGVVFNVLFRDVKGLFRIYPDTDPPGGYNIVFEYITSYWASPSSGTAPSQDAPLVNTDLVYFDPLLMNRRLKYDWLRAKGFPSADAKEEYEDALEVVKNADGSAATLSLNGQNTGDPLLGPWNAPITGYGS